MKEKSLNEEVAEVLMKAVEVLGRDAVLEFIDSYDSKDDK